jgi:signal transduction histidine kinase
LRRPLVAVHAAGVICLLGYLALLLWTGAGDDLLGDVAYNGLIVLGAALCLARGILGPERPAWLFLGLALAAWSAGDVYYSAVLNDAEIVPAVAPSDGLYWAFSALSAVAVGLLVRTRAGGATVARWLDAGVCALATASLGAAGIVETVLGPLHGDLSGQIPALTYPITDTVLLAVVVGGLALAGWRPDRTLGLVALGLVAMTAADAIYLLEIAEGTYDEGRMVDFLWPLSALLTAGAAVAPTAPRPHAPGPGTSRWLEAPPALMAAAAVALIAYDHFHRINTPALVLVVGALVAMIGRLALVSRENLVARGRLERLVADQAALGRVAGAVAADRPPDEVVTLVAAEAAALLDADVGLVTRFLPGEAIVVGSWGAGAPPAERHLRLDGDDLLARVAATGDAARGDGGPALAAGVAAPVVVDGRLWGAVATCSAPDRPPPTGAQDRLAQFAELVSMAIAGAEAADALRARAEELRRQAAVLRAVVDTVPATVLMADRDGRIVFANRGPQDGALGDARRGATVEERLAALAERTTDPDGFRAGVRALVAVPDETRLDEYEMADSGRVFRRYAAPVRGEEAGEGTIGRVLVIAEVTDERRTERAKDQFIEIASHELRTPLTSVLGYLELLEEGEVGPVAPEQRGILEVIHRNAKRLLHLAGDLLTVARADAGRLDLMPAPTDLELVVRQCAESARPAAAERGIALEVETEPIALLADAIRLAEVVDNLLSNALKFTPPGGRVSVTARQEAGRAAIGVADTGMGIPVAEVANLFKRFYRTERALTAAIPGTGLGLSISKMIVEAHGGTIDVSSREGHGTRFRVELPLDRGDGPGSGDHGGGASGVRDVA